MKRTHFSFPSIEQFKNVHRKVQEKAQFMGLDENKDPIFNRDIKLPTLAYEGTVKIHGCFSSKSLVTLSNGQKERIDNLKAGDSILSFNLNSQSFVAQVIDQTFVRELNKKWIKLYFDNGSFIECTEDHKFYTKNRGWVEAKNLTDKDVFLKENEEFDP